MRRWLVCILALLLLTGCTEAAPEAPDTAKPTALEALEAVWDLYDPQERFAVFGGDMNNGVDGKPGEYSMELRENLQYDVLLPADLLEYVESAATMVHMMNRNNFTSVALTLNQGMTTKDFANALRDGIRGQQWVCGFPDSLFIAAPADGVLVMAFGVADCMNDFVDFFDRAWPDAQVFTWENLA